MGNRKSFHEHDGDQSSENGNDPILYPPNWSYYVVNKRPESPQTKRGVIFFCVDLVALFVVIGIIKNLTSLKEIIGLIVAVWWLGGRAVMITMKGLSFWGNHAEGIKKGIKAIKELFTE